MLASVGLRVTAVAVGILALTCSGDMVVLRLVNMYNKALTRLSNINTRYFGSRAEWH